jgi:arylsulfatase A-like enzyme
MNVLLLSIDSLRADHVGCYGYARDTSPTLDRLAAEGVLFERCFVAGLPTHPAYTTLYTGQHPIRHGIVSHGGTAELAPNTPLLPQVLLEAGFTTCAVDNLARAKPWFGRGWEFYIDPSQRRKLSLLVSAEDLNARFIPWLKAYGDQPFFAHVHYWDPHTPYYPPHRYRHLFYDGNDPVAPGNQSLQPLWAHPLGNLWKDTWLKWLGGVTDADYVVALYDSEIRYLDDHIAEVLTSLEEIGQAENTLVIVMGDHGESLTEHHIYFEHHGLYDCTLRVPLIMRWPGQLPRGHRVTELVQSVSVPATILQAAGVDLPASMEGPSLLPLARGEPGATGSAYIVAVESTWQAKWCLRTPTHKLILAREPDLYGTPMIELYDLVNDPGETINLAEHQPQLTAQLRECLESWITRRLAEAGRAVDPVVEQGVTLAKRAHTVAASLREEVGD